MIKGTIKDCYENIYISVLNLFKANIKNVERKFSINFPIEYTKDITIQEFLKSLKGIDPMVLAPIVEDITDILRKDQPKIISDRDMFYSLLESTTNRCKNAFDKNRLLNEYLMDERDREKYKANSQKQIDYIGIDYPINSSSSLFKEIRQVQIEIKKIGAKAVRQQCSRQHIVMSVALGEGWIRKDLKSDKMMIITARKTDKTNLLIPSQTPIVTKSNDNWCFYGDDSQLPSSEYESHWTMYEIL